MGNLKFKPLSVSRTVFFIIVAIMAGFSGTVYADTIVPGTIYLATPPNPDASFDFGPEIGLVLMRGRPIGPGDASFIWDLQTGGRLSGPGSSTNIPFIVTALSSESRVPVNIGGTPFDVVFRLDSQTTSLGMLMITQNSPNDFGPLPEGTFSHTLELFFTADFTPVGGGPGSFSITSSVDLSSREPGAWSFDPEPNFVVTSASSNFFIIGQVFGGVAGRGGHVNSAATIPEPATILLFSAGLAGVAIKMRNRLKSDKSR
jgi:PEP-CTERM motif